MAFAPGCGGGVVTDFCGATGEPPNSITAGFTGIDVGVDTWLIVASRRASRRPSMRRSIQPTYDHRETGDRFYVETRVDGETR